MDRAVPLVWAGRYKGIFAAFVIFALVFPFPALVYAQEADVPPAADPSPAAQEPASAPTDTAPADAPSEAPAAPDTAPGEVLGEETVAPSADTPVVDDPLSPDSPAPTEESAVQPDPQPETLLSIDGGDSTNSSTNSLNPQFYAEPDPVTGSLVYEYALTVPPGRNGMEPTIPLRYTSQPSENTHVLGYGWDVKIPYIERINRTGTQSMYSQTYFRSSIDGEIVQASTTNTAAYSAKIDTGDFNQYQYSTSTGWVMTDKKGTIYTFGTSTAGRMDNPSNSSQVFRWVLQEMRDTNGNYVSYQYAKDQGQIYPYKISYTNSTTTSGRFEVEFLTEARSDVATSSDAGFPIVDAKRINEVQVKVDGSWVRKYVLGYGAGDNGARTMLRTITESGKDDAGAITTLPPVTFQYQAVNKGWTDASITMPITFNNYTTLADVNGDSLVDIIDSTKDSSGWAVRDTYINNGTNWVASSTWRVPIYFYILQTGAHPPNPDQGVRFADVNGDGLADLIQSADGLASSTKTYINNGAGWTATTTWAPPVMFVGSTTAFEMGARVTDANGDGLSDILYGNTGSYVGYINNGSSWVASSTWNPPVDFVNFNSTRPLQIEDINGDGLVDMVDSASGGSFGAHNNVYINNGAGWTIDPQWTMPVVFQDSSGYDQGVRLGDANGDGLIDVLQSSYFGSGVYLNTGHSWVASSTWSFPTLFTNSSTEPVAWLADTNGDGLVDLLQNAAGFGNDVFTNNTEKTDVLSRITYPQGGNTSFAYKAAAEYKNGSTPLNPLIPFTVDTVSSVTLDDGLGGIATTTYSYEGGNYYVASSTDRRLGGFQKITKTDPAGNKTLTYFHQGNGSNTSTGEYQDDGSKIGKVYRTEVYDGSNNLYSKSIVKWDKTSLGSGRTWVDMAQQVSSAYDGDSDHKDKAVSYAYSTTTGNLIQKFDWGEVNGSDDGSFSDTGTDFGSTTLSYAASTTAPGFVSSQLTQDQSANKVSETRYYYDGLSLGSVTKGNQTKKENWIVSSSYASTTKAYNGFGLVVQDRDAKGNLTSYTYDTSNLYPATSTNALSQATGYVYDYSSGNVIQKYDPNNRMHIQVYDGLDRPLTSLEPDPSTGALATTTTYAYASSTTPGSTSITQTQYLSSATSTARYTYFDGLNRKLQERVQSEAPTTYAAKDWKYNSRALVGSESLPYFSSGSSRTSATTDNTLYTSYIYDPLQRVTAVGNAVGTTTNVYDQWQTSTTDPDGKLKGYLKDARDNLVSVLEYATTTPFVTGYTWDLNGNLLSITDNASNTRSFIYDGLSRRTNAQDLHAPADATFGSTTYTYDVAGNLTQKLDAKNQTVQYAYDTLNRLLTENYTGAAGTEVTYTYDSCTDGKGKVCTASSTGALTQYSYTPTGLVKVATTTIVGTTTAFATSYDYDRQGNQATITYPDAGQVQYLYNAAGLVDAIQKKENGDSSFGALVTNIDYAPTGKPTLTQYANGDNATSTYNSSALYRLSRIQSKNSAGLTLQDLNYTYDAVGNITQLLDLASSTANATTTYSYDDLHRLTQALYSAPTGSYTQTYAYDSLGNITNKSDIGAYTYAGTGYANPHAATTIAGSVNTYDNNGNLLSGGGPTYTWDYRNRLTQSTTGGGGVTTSTTTPYAVAAGDGEVYKGGSATWSTEHDALTGTAADAAAVTGYVYSEQNGSAFWIGRVVLPFDTSAIPDDATIIGATLKVYVDTKSDGDNDGSDFIRVVQNTTASTTDIATADFDQVGSVTNPTAGASDVDITGVSSGAYLSIPLNTTGQGWISKTGYTKLGLREGHDATNSAPTASTGITGIRINTSDQTGTSQDPYLEIVYTVGSSSTSTSAYAYDHEDNRVKLTENSVSTYFPNKLYSATQNSATTTKSIFANGVLLATVDKGASTGGGGSGSDTGLKAPSVTGSIKNEWTSPSNAYVSDDVRTTSSGGRSTTDEQDYSSFTLGVPSGATINGIEVQVEAQRTTSNQDLAIKLSWNGGVSYSATTTKTITTTSDLLYTYGGPTSTWGRSWSDTDFSNANFLLYAANVTFGRNIDVDQIQVKVYYTPAGTSTVSSGTRFIHPDHLGSTNVVTDNLGNTLQTLQYHPYGSISAETGTDVSRREFIGEMTDELSGLSYLNARYYNSTQGRFISQDSVYWEVGQSQDGKAALLNPQAQNSYSYAQNNPIVNKDPNGRYIEASGSVTVPGYTFSLGLRFDNNGIDFFTSGGAGAGLEGGASLYWVPGVDLSHEQGASIVGNVSASYGLGGRFSKELVSYDPVNKTATQTGSLEVAIGVGAKGGLSGSIEEELSKPIFVWGNNSSLKSVPSGPQSQPTNSKFSNQVSQGSNSTNQSTNINNSNNGFSSSKFTQAVKQLKSAFGK